MLFGFIAAALAGFLLTAVPSWTGQRGFAGWPLALLAGLWLVGRLLTASSAHWPLGVCAAVDLAFLPALAAYLAPPLLRSRNRNTKLLMVLAALSLANASFYWGMAHADPGLARRAVVAGVDLVLLLVTIVGGRIVPAFTGSALKQQGRDSLVRTARVVDAIAVIAMAGVLLIDVALPNGRAAGSMALIASAAQLARLGQ